MNAKQLLQNRLTELNIMLAGKRLEHDKLQEISANQKVMKLDNTRTNSDIKWLNKEITSIDNMIIVNEVVLATC